MKTFLSLLLCFVAVWGSVALAQDKGMTPAADDGSDGPGMGRWWSNPRVAERLGLTAEQKKRIQDIVFKSGERMVDMRAQKEKARLEMLRLLGADALDDAALEKALDRSAQAQCALEREMLSARLDVARVLTREQRVSMAALWQERRGGDGESGPRRMRRLRQ